MRGSGDPLESFLQALSQSIVVLLIPVLEAEAARLGSVQRLFNAQHAVQETLQLVFGERQGRGLVHGCRCEVGRNRSRSLDFVALNITTRPEPGQGKVTVRNINCTNQFPMNDQPEVGLTMT